MFLSDWVTHKEWVNLKLLKYGDLMVVFKVSLFMGNPVLANLITGFILFLQNVVVAGLNVV